ncbi:LytR C-terminal domain-containing protein [Promicromonospora panici]|uniref:LytR C-terminal domain-containing protein n=1 Tax=Promicromonospora panici TaxID=2219658 RepID=UPI00101CE6D1|nr:LytR C-terminal domain-containing protein [Promicromonospora panici]
MTKSGYPYPPDEFDVAVPGGAPVGVHRAPRSGWSSAWPFLLVAVVCAAVAWGGITLLSGGDDPAEASGNGSPSASASAPAASPSTSPSPEASPSSSPSTPTGVTGDPTAADLTAGVQVLNSGGPTGSAKSTAETIVAAGFDVNNVVAEDDTAGLGDGYTETTVLYGENRADTAAAVAQAIGATTAIESADVTASAYAVIVLIK